MIEYRVQYLSHHVRIQLFKIANLTITNPLTNLQLFLQ
jgi:hypothetical protein